MERRRQQQHLEYYIQNMKTFIRLSATAACYTFLDMRRPIKFSRSGETTTRQMMMLCRPNATFPLSCTFSFEYRTI